ncbi:MAG: hypothetical protein JSS56_18860 [Proteobacteria bacterium]|nr:hypothetical protein [Pseudomonadota bacterium]
MRRESTADCEGHLRQVHGRTAGRASCWRSVAELIHGYVVARKLETTVHELIESVFPHPTLSEALYESVRVWDLETRRETWQVGIADGRVVGVDFSPDGKLLATAADIKGRDASTTTQIWNCITLNWSSAFRPTTFGLIELSSRLTGQASRPPE